MTKEIDFKKSIFPISVAADILEVNPRTLRTYEKRKLVKPSRNDGNRRYYSLKDLSLLEYVHYLIQIKKINAAGVREILSVLHSLPEETRDLFIARAKKI